jgi:hypothetical protein
LKLFGPRRRVAKRPRVRVKALLRSQLPAISSAGRRVFLQFRRRGRWHRIARARTKAGGHAVLRSRLRAGRYVMRLSYAGAPELSAATSPTFVLKVPRRRTRS